MMTNHLIIYYNTLDIFDIIIATMYTNYLHILIESYDLCVQKKPCNLIRK